MTDQHEGDEVWTDEEIFDPEPTWDEIVAKAKQLDNEKRRRAGLPSIEGTAQIIPFPSAKSLGEMIEAHPEIDMRAMADRLRARAAEKLHERSTVEGEPEVSSTDALDNEAEWASRAADSLSAEAEEIGGKQWDADAISNTSLDAMALKHGEASASKAAPRTPGAGLIVPKPFSWPDPKSIPRREWIYGRRLIRGYASLTVAPGGAGKSTVLIADMLAMISGRNLVGERPDGKLNVWYFNGEDPLVELERRIAAAAMHFEIDRHSSGRLYVNSGRDEKLVIAHQEASGVSVVFPMTDHLVDVIRQRRVDVLGIDPFVSCHGVPENSNDLIDKVAKEWGVVAHRANCAIELVHHIRKTGGERATIEDARGGVALRDGVRSARVLNSMTPDEATKAGIEGTHKSYLCAEDGKSNMAPPSQKKTWFRLISVSLGNDGDGKPADEVGAAVPWIWPDHFEGVTVHDLRLAQRALEGKVLRLDPQSGEWAGHEVGRSLGIDTSARAGKAKVIELLKRWTSNGMFVVVERKNAKGELKKFLAVGECAND